MWKYFIILTLFLIACKPLKKNNNDQVNYFQPSLICPPCQKTKGRIEDFPYPTINQWYKTKVYLPPCYDIHTQCNYPVLYLIHGAGGNSINWITMGLDQIMDHLIETKKISPYIVVMPVIPRVKINGAAYEGWYTKNEWLTDELVAGIDATYRTKKNRLYRGISGFSQGGQLSGLYGWKHPELFGAIGLYGAVQPTGGYIPGWTRRSPELSALLNKVPKKFTPHVYIDVGNGDGLWVENLSLTFHLRDRLMPYIFYIEKGIHARSYWESHLEEYLLWFNTVFGKPASRIQQIKKPQALKKIINKQCNNYKGKRIRIQINHPAKIDNSWPATEIYLPPCYSENIYKSYPVLYLLHEEDKNPIQWFKMDLINTMDKLIAEKVIPPFILVAPPQSESLNNYTSWFIKNVLQNIEKRFRINNHRAFRGIAGLSKGGTLALKIGHDYPELFGFIGGYSTILNENIGSLKKAIKKTPLDLRPQIFLDIGDEDPFRLSQKSLHNFYTINNWAHTSTISKGAHNIEYWTNRFEYYLFLHGNAFGSVIKEK